MIAKMRSVLCILAGCFLLAQAVQIPSQVTDKSHLVQQKIIYELFWHVDQPTIFFPELIQKSRRFNVADNIDKFTDKEAITEFLDLLKHGILPRGQVFSISNPEMRHQAMVLFRVLHSAKNFDAFYNTAVWARFNVNEMMFTYSLSVAVMHRPDTKHFKLPPLYELLPNMFFNDDVMQKAYNIAMGDVAMGVTKTVEGVNHYVLPANYSGWYVTRKDVPELKMSYFTEDVELNSFYFLINQVFPRFMPSKMYNLPGQARGEYYFFVHKQLLCRYHLERLANDLGEIDYVSVDRPIESGFYPTMHHRNGLPLPHRESNSVVPLHKYRLIQMVKDLHNRISTAIDLGYVVDSKGHHIDIYSENGLNILGNIIEGNADSINPRLYGDLDLVARKILGFGLESNVKYQIVPSALEYFTTSLRDPVFYSMYKNILTYYLRYKENIPKYTKEDLLFSGVEIQSVTVDKLVTYFDHFDSMLNNGVSIHNHKEAMNTLIMARQHRLNHKPFTYHIAVNSDKSTKAMVRIFLGPKHDVYGHELDLTKNYMTFLEMDQFVVDLKVGTNNIDRSSHESLYVMPDEVSSTTLYKKILASIDSADPFSYSTQTTGFPDRLILPKGKKEGMTYKLFVMVSPIEEKKFTHIVLPAWGRQPYDGRSMGFPLDRPVDPLHFAVPNMMLNDVVIYHKEIEELNVPGMMGYKNDRVATSLALRSSLPPGYKMLRLWLLGLLAVPFVQASYFDTRTADTAFLLKQKKVYNLLYHVSQPMVVNRDLYEEGQAWSIEANANSYGNYAAMKFLSVYKSGMLGRGEMFSVYYPKLQKEMAALFDLFYYANDFEVFYKTALWARANVNEGQFTFALYNAVMKRPDTKYIQLPPPYELYPYYFFNSEVLNKVHHPKASTTTVDKRLISVSDSPNNITYIINANYSGWYFNREYYMENKLNYFVEDIGLNSYYFFFRQEYPFWQESKEYGFPAYRGEEYLYCHKLLLNRYNLERLANDLPKIEDFNWNKPFYPGYYPTMTFNNGLPFPQRPSWSTYPYYKYKYIKDVSDMESRLTAAIDSGFVLGSTGKWHNIYTPEGLSMLGNMLEGNADSCNREFYGSIDALGRKILGFNLESMTNYQILPSALETYSSSLRDPAFYRLYKRILDYYRRFKMREKPYTMEEVIFPNLNIQSFAVDKLITYFDEFDATISNGLMVRDDTEAETLYIKIRQYRLNHKPFNFHIAVNADKPMKAAIRIFLGPASTSHHKLIDLQDSLEYFYEMDNWIVDLNAGLNKITRSSKDCYFLWPDQEPSELFYQKVMRSLNTSEPFTYNERISGFPERLLLPKGKKEGMPFQFFLYINPVSKEEPFYSRIWGNYVFDGNSYGFPLDKPYYDFVFKGPNMMFKKVFIYHKDDYDMNITY
ncbi:uncharacterized protein LOC122403032 [Colletes gigas]|uniref:uncharacterized protein LOC122403032 n=1 Tax=Colletes gigas TaxID=935657 RepID=UPI001C9B9966|nr:uncharacterized protein LOC122403032 [Colletes gigas]